MKIKAIQMLETNETLQLAMTDEEGYPLIYPMEKVAAQKIERVLFITKRNSNKVKILSKNAKSCVECHEDQEILWLFGETEVVTDFQVIKELLPQAYWKRVMSHENFRDYCVLLFKTQKAKLYKNGKTFQL